MSPTHRSHAGLDISDLVLRVAVMAPRRGRPRLTQFQEMLISPGLIVDGLIQQPAAVSERLKLLWAHARPSAVSTKQAVVSLPDRRTFIKLLTVERPASGLPLASRIESELVQHIPFALDEVYYDWQLVDQTAGQVRALLSAAPRPLVDQYTATLHGAGITAIAFETESQALVRAVFGQKIPSASHLVVDIGGTRTTVVVLGNGTIQFASSVAFSGAHLTQSVAKELHLSLEDAEKAKQLYGLQKTRGRGTVSKALLAALPQLTTKLEELEQFYHNHFQATDTIQGIILTGGGAQLQGLPEYLESTLKCPVRRAEPGTAIDIGNDLPAHRLASFSTALGLAQRPWT